MVIGEDRLIAFYTSIFDAPVLLDEEDEGTRHAFIKLGPHTALHPFQIPGIEPPGPQPIFQRRRLDHFSLNAASAEAFQELYRRAVAHGACDGVVMDMGSLLQFSFDDPDGGRHEVSWNKPGVPFGQGSQRAHWKRVEMG